MNFPFCRAVLLTTLVVFAAPCRGQPSQSDRAAELDELLLQLRQLTGVPAYSVAVVQHGRLMMQSAVGEVDSRNHFQASPEHRFRLASVSKVVGATMLALLVQAGRLDPDAPISDYIDGLPDQYRQLTALQLLSHTSGLPHYQPRDALIAETHYDSAVDSLASVGDRLLSGEPGETYLYSSHGYTVLGALYESITGRPLIETAPEFLEHFTGRETPKLEDWRQRDARRTNLFEAEAGGPRTLKPRDQSYSPFGTGFTANAEDLAWFGDAVLHSALIDDRTREMMFRPITLDGGGKTGTYLYEVAFGWRVGTDGYGRTVFHHAGITQGARSVLVLYPESGLSIAFLSNATWTAQIERTAFALANTVLERQAAIHRIGAWRFAGSFDGQAISGIMSCEPGSSWCRLSDQQGALTEWLMRYAPEDVARAVWPAQWVDGDGGPAIELLTTVGIVELRYEFSGSSYSAEIGNGRLLTLRFETT